MPKADFNQEFPTRASLRRARQEQQEAQRKKAEVLKGIPVGDAAKDVFDAIPESNRNSPVKPAAPRTAPAGSGSKSAPSAKSAPKANTPADKSQASKNPVTSANLTVVSDTKAAPAVTTPKAPSAVAQPTTQKPTEAKAPTMVSAPKSEVTQQAKNKVEGVAAAPVAPTSVTKPAQAKQSPAAVVKPVAPVNTKSEAAKPAPAKPEAAKAAPDTKAAALKAMPAAKAEAPKVVPAAKIEAPKAVPVTKPAPAKAVPAAKTEAPKAAPATKAETPKAAPVANAANTSPVAKPAPAAPAAEKASPAPKPATPSDVPTIKAAKPEPKKDISLSTAEGRRQAFRELNPSAGERDTFLRPEDETSFRAERGFRGFLSRMGFAMEPSAQEVEERNWRRAVGKRLNEPKTISVVNGKGGANKTPTAVLLSAVFGRNSGDPVLVWDNNGTRGTLGWRTLKGSHTRHSMDLLDAADQLKETRVGDPAVNDFVHYQPEDCYSVLRTDPTLLASEQHVNAADFDVLHEIVSRFFSLTIVDSGNDESAERWMRMIDHTDQLVIASTTVEEHAEAGALLLEALAKRGGHYADLAENAVVIISQHQPQGNDEQLNRIAHGFRRLARQVVTVPYDAALVKGQIRFDGLRPATRRAWLHATAAVAGALHN
ncbi:hypothetical protein CQ018_02440 [Arthrobacter sp. MYb227]|uniref:MinD/ParA family ATP-binding protein n=1 Tax=Arthrobacter sp. MYb227 TaxID=1848601 RepID=UPI000CFC78BA|nr:hypothetical protein [Arthrobacter sp. MYb227]PQZ96159.1 hypothetical protein CQ018_02440 [Arthrobacter sp. MYb227]